MKVKSIKRVEGVKVKKIDLDSPELFEIEGLHIQAGPIGRGKFKGGLREAITCRDNQWVWLTADFSAEEMVLTANYSKEPGFLKPLLEGKDIHMYIAKMMYGYEDPNHRTAVKTLNFAGNYGAYGSTIARKLKCSVERGVEILEHYKKTLSHLTRWKESVIKEGRRKGMVFTYFGRPRMVYKYYNSSDRSLHGYADRTCVNHTIQGCVPVDAYIELDDKVVTLHNVLLKKLIQDGHEIVPSLRGKDPIFKVVFKSGDFTFCNYAHGFIYQNKDKFMVNRVNDVKSNVKNLMSPLSRKVLPKLGVLLRTKAATCWSLLILKVVNEQEISKGSREIAAYLWKIWFSRSHKELEDKDYIKIMRLRSLAGLYGFNLVNKKGTNKYYLKRKRVKASKVYQISDTGTDFTVCSCTALNGLQSYNCCGVMNKNTGGDIIRIVIVKFFKKFYENSEFGEFLRENVRFINTVHDEINLQVKVSALKRVREFVHEIMYFKPSNFIVPIKEEPGISVPQYSTKNGKLKSATWGTCLDFDYIDDDNQIHLKEYEEDGVYKGIKV